MEYWTELVITTHPPLGLQLDMSIIQENAVSSEEQSRVLVLSKKGAQGATLAVGTQLEEAGAGWADGVGLTP
jgi:hypothetical protein